MKIKTGAEFSIYLPQLKLSGDEMYKILKQFRAQYWFWYVRNELILNKLKSELDQEDKAELQKLLIDPTLEDIFGKESISDQIFSISGDEQLRSKFLDDSDKFRVGSRPSTEATPKWLDRYIPGSLSAFIEGPSGLFEIIEANSLVEAVFVIARHLLRVLKEDCDLYLGDSELERLTKSLSEHVQLGMFGGAFKLLNIIEEIINYIFPNNELDKFVSALQVVKTSPQQLEPKHLFQTKFLKLEVMAPIAVGYGFFRARFFDEIHYLSKVCYQEQFLTLLNKKFIMNEAFWLFESYDNELSSAEYLHFKESERKKVNANRIEQAPIKNIFCKAHFLTEPVLFSKCFPTEK